MSPLNWIDLLPLHMELIEIEGSRVPPSIDPDRDRGIDGFPLTLGSIEIEGLTGSSTPDGYASILALTTPVQIWM